MMVTLIKLTATLTSKGISFTERREACTRKGESTFVNERGTHYNEKALLRVKTTFANTIPAERAPMLQFYTVCLQEHLQFAKELLLKKFEMHLQKAMADVSLLATGYNSYYEQKAEDDGRQNRRRRRQSVDNGK